jgi:hypothetical protein
MGGDAREDILEPSVGIDSHALTGSHEAPQHRAGMAAPVASKEDPVVAANRYAANAALGCGCYRSPGRRPRCSGAEPSSSSACIGRPAPLDFSVAPPPASPADIHATCPEWAATRAGATPTAPPHSIRVPVPLPDITARSEYRPYPRLVGVQRFDVIPTGMTPASYFSQTTRRVLEEGIIASIGIGL